MRVRDDVDKQDPKCVATSSKSVSGRRGPTRCLILWRFDGLAQLRLLWRRTRLILKANNISIYIYIDRSIKHSSIDSHFSARAQILRTLHWPYFGWCSKYFMGNSFAFAIFFVIMICVASTRGPWLRLKLMMWWKILTTRWHRTTEAKIAAPWCPNRIRNINTNSSRRFFTHITCKFNSRTIGRTNGRIKYSNSKHGSCRPIHGRSKHRGSCKYKQYKHHYRTWGIATNSKWLGLNFSIKRRATGSIRLANISRSTTTTGRATTTWSRNNCTIYERQHQEETFT